MPLPPETNSQSVGQSLTYPLGEPHAPPNDERMMALLALSHTPIEHALYAALLAATEANNSRAATFTLRELMKIAGVGSYSSVRRSLKGLERKLSIEARSNSGEGKGAAPIFFVYRPAEIFSQRMASGLTPFPKEFEELEQSSSYALAITRVVQNHTLSRREAQVALLCTQGLTNAEIGAKLQVSEQTVKFHLRHVFIKCGVRRRAELISSLLRQYSST
jgi:DNA-binding CsgD family transcriptional regulator